MCTRMTSQRLDVLETRMAEVESSLRNQVALGRSHETTLKEHSAQLGSLMTNVGELTKALQTMHVEMRDGFLWQHNSNGTSTDSTRGTSNTMTASDGFRLEAKKVELPAFNRGDSVGWVPKAETYFPAQGSPPEMQVQLAQICMEGMTWHWFKILRDSDPQLDWEKLKRSLMDRYGDHDSGNPFSQLKLLQQNGNIDEYVEAFEVLMAEVSPMSEEQYIGFFLGGLKEKIRMEVLAFEPPNRHKKIFVSLLIERRLNRYPPQNIAGGWRGTQQNNGATSTVNSVAGDSKTHGGQSNHSLSASSGSNDKGTRSGKTQNSTSNFRGGTRNLCYQELMNRRSRGLCFKCG